MKKIISTILAAITVLSLCFVMAGCSKKKPHEALFALKLKYGFFVHVQEDSDVKKLYGYFESVELEEYEEDPDDSHYSFESMLIEFYYKDEDLFEMYEVTVTGRVYYSKGETHLVSEEDAVDYESLYDYACDLRAKYY